MSWRRTAALSGFRTRACVRFVSPWKRRPFPGDRRRPDESAPFEKLPVMRPVILVPMPGPRGIRPHTRLIRGPRRGGRHGMSLPVRTLTPQAPFEAVQQSRRHRKPAKSVAVSRFWESRTGGKIEFAAASSGGPFRLHCLAFELCGLSESEYSTVTGVTTARGPAPAPDPTH